MYGTRGAHELGYASLALWDALTEKLIEKGVLEAADRIAVFDIAERTLQVGEGDGYVRAAGLIGDLRRKAGGG